MKINEFEKNLFFKSFNMVPITPINNVNNSSENSVTDSSTRECSSTGEPVSLFEKNNRIVTGFEDFCLTNGSLTRYPSKDFDFVDGKVVCYQCYQKFESRSSYRIHIGTGTCVKPRLARNSVYIKYKKTGSKKTQRTPVILSDIHVFQTRHRSYTNVAKVAIGGQKKERNSPANGSQKKQRTTPYKVPEKKPLPSNNTDVEPRKRGRPRKIKVEVGKV